MATSTGIDWGMGLTNVDHETGIRYGAISANEVAQAWSDSSEGNYGDPSCPRCGGAVVTYHEGRHRTWKGNGGDYACRQCKRVYWSDGCYPEEALSWDLEDKEYTASQSGEDSDIFILKSPYFTLAEYCSPCAPGAGYVMNEGDVKTYCFGHDWFWDTDEKRAPYRVFSVATGEEVMPAGEGE